MKHLFYLIGLLFIYREVLWMIKPESQYFDSIRRIELGKKNKSLKWEDSSQDYKDEMIYFIISLLCTNWLFIGLASFNWVAFLLMLAFQFIIIAPIDKLLRRFNQHVINITLHWINSVVGFSFGVFVVINSYHLKINLLDLILKLCD